MSFYYDKSDLCDFNENYYLISNREVRNSIRICYSCEKELKSENFLKKIFRYHTLEPSMVFSFCNEVCFTFFKLKYSELLLTVNKIWYWEVEE